MAMELYDRVVVTAMKRPAKKVSVIAIGQEPTGKDRVNGPYVEFLSGGSPPYPPNSRLAKGPELRLGAFFCD